MLASSQCLIHLSRILRTIYTKRYVRTDVSTQLHAFVHIMRVYTIIIECVRAVMSPMSLHIWLSKQHLQQQLLQQDAQRFE